MFACHINSLTLKNVNVKCKVGKSFAKPMSTIMIEGQRDSETGEVHKGRRNDSLTQEERAEKKERWGIRKLR